MNFSSAYRTIPQPYQGNPFEFSPAAFAVLLTQARQVTDGPFNRDGLNVGNLSDDFEVHALIQGYKTSDIMRGVSKSGSSLRIRMADCGLGS